MALYTILFGMSLFMIALVMAIIKKMFFHWKEEHKIERMCEVAVERPAVSVIIYAEKCLIRRRDFGKTSVCDILSKSDLELDKMAPGDDVIAQSAGNTEVNFESATLGTRPETKET